jgi:hypothetical protein
MTTLKFKTVETRTGGDAIGYMNEKTLECGSWTIAREGKYVDMGYENTTFISWAGDWSVIRNEVLYGSFKTKKEAVKYIQNWIRINPKDL